MEAYGLASGENRNKTFPEGTEQLTNAKREDIRI